MVAQRLLASLPRTHGTSIAMRERVAGERVAVDFAPYASGSCNLRVCNRAAAMQVSSCAEATDDEQGCCCLHKVFRARYRSRQLTGMLDGRLRRVYPLHTTPLCRSKCCSAL